MDVMNNGTVQVKFDKNYVKADIVRVVAANFFQDVFDTGPDAQDAVFDKDSMTICFNDFRWHDIEDELNELQKRLDPTRKKIWLESKNGIDVWDGEEGFVAVDHGVALYHDGSEYDLYYATDKQLIAILRKRGYVVTKKEKAK